ncbi:MAG TPA: hypothetical protein VJK52_02910 [Candidatus Nanoarchaeia archaeon]|nr:hypothetical protein [Candidatus Nanoarchaeia archaeon]
MLRRCHMGMCGKCCKVMGVLLFLIGLGQVLVDLGKWTFWNLQWYSAVLVVVGIGCFCSSFCKECMAK